MPKIKVKSHSGAKKRFKETGTGKFRYQKTYKRHLLTGRSTKRKRHLRKPGIVGHSHHHQVVDMLPYGTP